MAAPHSRPTYPQASPQWAPTPIPSPVTPPQGFEHPQAGYPLPTHNAYIAGQSAEVTPIPRFECSSRSGANFPHPPPNHYRPSPSWDQPPPTYEHFEARPANASQPPYRIRPSVHGQRAGAPEQAHQGFMHGQPSFPPPRSQPFLRHQPAQAPPPHWAPNPTPVPPFRTPETSPAGFPSAVYGNDFQSENHRWETTEDHRWETLENHSWETLNAPPPSHGPPPPTHPPPGTSPSNPIDLSAPEPTGPISPSHRLHNSRANLPPRQHHEHPAPTSPSNPIDLSAPHPTGPIPLSHRLHNSRANLPPRQHHEHPAPPLLPGSPTSSARSPSSSSSSSSAYPSPPPSSRKRPPPSSSQPPAQKYKKHSMSAHTLPQRSGSSNGNGNASLADIYAMDNGKSCPGRKLTEGATAAAHRRRVIEARGRKVEVESKGFMVPRTPALAVTPPEPGPGEVSERQWEEWGEEFQGYERRSVLDVEWSGVFDEWFK